jgi:hypothetical protein
LEPGYYVEIGQWSFNLKVVPNMMGQLDAVAPGPADKAQVGKISLVCLIPDAGNGEGEDLPQNLQRHSANGGENGMVILE